MIAGLKTLTRVVGISQPQVRISGVMGMMGLLW